MNKEISPLFKLHFFRDLNYSQRTKIFQDMGILSTNAERNQVTHTVERMCMEFAVRKNIDSELESKANEIFNKRGIDFVNIFVKTN